MQSNSVSSAQAPDTSGDPPGAGRPTARRSEILHWESLAWLAIGAAWVVSAWPGLLVQWDGLAGAAVLGLGVLAGFVAWQVVVHGARLDRPSSWVGARWRAAPAGRRAKSRRLLAMTVMLDAAAWSVSGISWIVAARAFDWSQTLTGASLQLACGVAFLGWSLLHIPAVRRLVASANDLVVVSRRVLGSGPPTIDTQDDETGKPAATALRAKQRRVRLVQRWLLNPAMRVLTYLGLLPITPCSRPPAGAPVARAEPSSASPASPTPCCGSSPSTASEPATSATSTPNRTCEFTLTQAALRADLSSTGAASSRPPSDRGARRPATPGANPRSAAAARPPESWGQFGARAFGRRCEVAGRDHSSLRTAQRSGKTGTDSVVRR
jgi:hypothetical protein